MSAAPDLLPSTAPPLSGPSHLTSPDRAGGSTGPEVTARVLWQLLLPPANPGRDDETLATVLGAPANQLAPGRSHRRPGGLAAVGSAGTAVGAGHAVGLMSRPHTPPVGSGPVRSPSAPGPDLSEDVNGYSVDTGSVSAVTAPEDGQQLVEQARPAAWASCPTPGRWPGNSPRPSSRYPAPHPAARPGR